MSTDAVAVLGFISLFALMLLRVPVGMAMGLVIFLAFNRMLEVADQRSSVSAVLPVAAACQRAWRSSA